MKIVDTTTYYKEDLMLDLRFNILDKYVDHFVVCEAKFSHSGQKKELFFNIKNFEKFKKKIIYLVVENEPDSINNNHNNETSVLRNNSVQRINFQRDFIKQSLNLFSPDDFILHSDNDEIPQLQNINFDELNNEMIIFCQKLFYYKLNLLLPNMNWYGTKGCKLKDLKSLSWLRNIKNKRYKFFRLDTFFSDTKYQNVKIVNEGGWHFSNLKNIDDLKEKYLNDENHAEFSQQMTLDKIKSDVSNWTIDYDHNADKRSSSKNKKVKLKKVDNNYLPDYISKNISKYNNWLV
jgi:beta-1,4-mannosyl-glycoprotein beta-1,4-N-acetylglucosaminyltransferase